MIAEKKSNFTDKDKKVIRINVVIDRRYHKFFKIVTIDRFPGCKCSITSKV